MGIFDWKHWMVILLVAVLIFGTKKLKNAGADVGESIKSFRKAMSDNERTSDEATARPLAQPQTIDGETHQVVEPVNKAQA
ncbi:twin-arginine translocase TatA/TatE family subunit [Pseudomonas sp. RHF3.3-3]|uniref:twin-arginine translocase TatA/TatE family subunit n=1 Tax=Pseudomonas sp. RHF3.3-3 TaxID=3396624 RepID=UPI003A84CB58